MDTVPRSLSSGLVSGTGILLALFAARHLGMMQSVLGRLVMAIVPLVLACVLIYGGYWLYTSPLDAHGVTRVTMWVFAGMIVLGLTTIWVISHQFVRGLPFEHAPFVIVNSTTVGGLAGLVTGVYDVRGKELAVEQASLESEQEKLQFINSVLRHNILNSMNIVLGRTDLLREQLSAVHQETLNVIETQGQNIVTHVENVRQYTRVAAGEDTELELTAVNLSRIVANELDGVRTSYPGVRITDDIADDVHVMADELLAVLVENLLGNVIQRTVESPPHLTLSLDMDDGLAQLTLRDDGPGISASQIKDAFSWDGISSGDTEVGFALTNMLVQRYNGNIQIRERGENGVEITVNLPRVQEPRASATGPLNEGSVA